MSDFFQPGVITTLHRLKKGNFERMEVELEFYSKYHPIALVLPSLYSELKEKALKAIVSEIQKIKYVNQVIITLGRADQKEFDHAREFFSVLPQETIIIWNDGEIELWPSKPLWRILLAFLSSPIGAGSPLPSLIF